VKPRSGPCVAVALVAAVLLAGCSTAATPSPRPSATAMPAGTYTSKVLRPQLTYTVPAGWLVSGDEVDYFGLRPAISDIVGLFVFRGATAMSQDKACPDKPEPGVEPTAAGLTAWIRGLKALKVSPPRLAAVGTLRGTELDVEIASDWKQSCPFANGLPAVPLLLGQDATYHWVVAGTEKMRLTILEGPDRQVLIIDADAFDGALFDEIAVGAAPIIKTFTFKGG
jgi:hypothetical protein